MTIQSGLKCRKSVFDSAVRQAHDSDEAKFEFDGIVHQIAREDGCDRCGRGDRSTRRGLSVAKLRVEPFEDKGDPAILLNTDRDGIRMFHSAAPR
jgi:hypothetical protein